MDRSESNRFNRLRRMQFLRNRSITRVDNQSHSQRLTPSLRSSPDGSQQPSFAHLKCSRMTESITLHSTVDEQGNLRHVTPIHLEPELALVENRSQIIEQDLPSSYSTSEEARQCDGVQDDVAFVGSSSSHNHIPANAFANRRLLAPVNLGGFDCVCPYCGASMWFGEKATNSSRRGAHVFSLCCKEGSVLLPPCYPTPPFLDSLLDYKHRGEAAKFRENIRVYNSMFQFTSIGGKVDHGINTKPGPYVFKIGGQVHHRIGSLLPPIGQRPKFAQLYICDTINEVSNRIDVFDRSSEKSPIAALIVQKLVEMLDETNEIVKSFRTARERFSESEYIPIRLRLIGRRDRDERQYDAPQASEIAGLIVGEEEVQRNERDIIVEHQSNRLQRINELHPSFMAMQYPLLFPFGEDGFRLGIKYRDSGHRSHLERKTLTMMEFYAFLIQQRLSTGQTFLRGGKLFQQFIVDAFLCVERMRLQWIRDNQKHLRSEIYQGVRDAVTRGDLDGRAIGKRIILPSTFVSGPRFFFQNYQDAMAICRHYGHPDPFITFTCNPKWPEVDEALSLISGQKIEDRPDILARLFRLRLKCLMDDLTKNNYFGEVIAVVNTIEFQKRGLPHTHILLWLHPKDKCQIATDIDRIISAEIPNKDVNLIAHEAVTNFMIHGPCGFIHLQAPCMVDDKCSKFYPKAYQEETIIQEGGTVLYRRRIGLGSGCTVKKNGVELDSRFVVPHNVDLIVRHQAHINVEICSKSKLIKYLFKYINKGPDRVRAVIEETSTSSNGDQNAIEVDEIKMFLDCRYISAHEACWRLFGFDVHHREPAVIRLPIHMPNEHYITFANDVNLSNVLQQPLLEKTMFTEWMETNRLFPHARTLTYTDFPTQWVWLHKQKIWKERARGRAIGRINFVHPAAGELYFMRLMLNVIKGARNFVDLRNIDGVVHQTYQSACVALGLLGDDKEWHDALDQASQWATGFELRQLFVTLIMFCEVADPLLLWVKNWTILAEDIEYRLNRLLGSNGYSIPISELQNHVLVSLEELFNKNGSSLKDHKLPMPRSTNQHLINDRLLREEMAYNLAELELQHLNLVAKLNADQRLIYDVVLSSIHDCNGNLFFVYGHGGTGKTFLWNTIIAAIRSSGKIVLAVASSGIASLLLPGGRTAHSRFKIPLQIDETSTCQIKRGTELGRLVQLASLIVWDEAPMIHRHCFEAFERSL